LFSRAGLLAGFWFFSKKGGAIVTIEDILANVPIESVDTVRQMIILDLLDIVYDDDQQVDE